MKEFKGYKRGVNLGGWFSQCNHTKERYDNFIVEEDFKTIQSWGLDHVRLPIDYELVETADGQYVPEGFAYIQKAIDWAGKYGLKLVLDVHKTFGFSFDKGENEIGFFDNADYQERFYRLWEELAKRYAVYKDRVCFELLNEVTDQAYSDRWNKIASECIRRIRAIDKDVYILVGGYWNNSVDAVADIDVPMDDHIVLNFHCYDPLMFTHQGAGWIDGMPADFRCNIDATYGEIKADTMKVKPDVAGQLDILPLDEKFSPAYFEKRWAGALKVAEEKNAALYCGEYGVISLADMEQVLVWFKAMHDTFEKYNISRCAWSFRQMDFGLIDADHDSIRDRLIKLL